MENLNGFFLAGKSCGPAPQLDQLGSANLFGTGEAKSDFLIRARQAVKSLKDR